MSDSASKTTPFLNITVLALGVLMVLAAFLPISTYGRYYENVSYIKGFSYLLFLTPFFVIGPAIAALYKKLPNEGIWYAVVGLIGLFLTVFTDIAGNNMLTSFVEFNSNGAYIHSHPGLGTITLFIGYFLITLIGYIFITNNKKRKTPQIKDTNKSNITDKESLLDEMAKKVALCKRCELSKTRKNSVFGEGNINAEIMFVGEAPGRDEDLQGKPFVGRAGKLFYEILKDIGLKREDVYIVNCLKCRPPANRDPKPEELIACFDYLKEQIKIIKPKVIGTLGRYSTYQLTSQKGALGTFRGRVFLYGSIKVVPLYHPAYLLRNPDAIDIFTKDLKMIKGLAESDG